MKYSLTLMEVDITFVVWKRSESPAQKTNLAPKKGLQLTSV
jgi:hypothetical protein